MIKESEVHNLTSVICTDGNVLPMICDVDMGYVSMVTKLNLECRSIPR